MTLADIKSLVHHSTGKDKILGVFPTLINQALRDIQTRRSFICNKDVVSVTITAGTDSVALPSNFKEPQRGKNPLKSNDVYNPTGYVVWKLLSNQELERVTEYGDACASRRASIRTNAAGHTLYISALAASNIAFLLDSYVFLPALVADADTNYLLTNYPQMVLEKTKELAYGVDEEPGDADKAMNSYARYVNQFNIASADDASRETSGRSFRMGGE